jgi:hypothetical protein
MVRRMMIPILACAAVGLCLPAGAFAQEAVTDAQNKLLSKRAAEADAYRKLAETIRGLHITSDTLVRDFVTEYDVIEADLDAFIRGVRLGEPRWYEDLSCEVPAEVTVAKLITQLKELHTRYYKGDTIKGTDFENMKQFINKDVIQVVGMGAPRPDLPPDLPEGTEEVITQVETLPRPTLPALWMEMGPQARLMAQRAASLDAMRRLLERIKGLRVTSDTLVRDFVTEWDKIETEARGYLVGAREVKTYYHANEPIVEVTYAIPLEQVITTIQELHNRYYKGDRVKAVDIVNIKQNLKHKEFEATGMGVPPPQFVHEVATAAEITYPDWTTTKITATGQGTDPAIDTPQGKLKAVRAAELDAKRKLAEQIHGLQISSDTLVRDFVTEYDEINAQLDAVLAGALVERTDCNNGICEATVSIPGMEVWSVVHQQMLIVSRK